jgi:hypothetical protein
MTVADLLQLRAVNEAAIDSADSAVAVVVQRERQAGEPIAGESLYGGNVRADVLVLSASDGRELFRTPGQARHAGYWRPVWSPGGNLLAMLELRADTLSICVWSRDSGRLTCVPGDGSIDFLSRWTAVTSTDGPQRNNTPFAWLNDSTIAYVLLPRGIVDQASTRSHAVGDSVATMWSREQAGRVPTVSVLETPWPVASTSPGAALQLENVVSGESTSIGSIPYFPPSRRSIILSPDSMRAIVLADWEPHTPAPGHSLGFSNQVRIRLGVAVLSQGGAVSWAPSLPYGRGARWMRRESRFAVTVKRSYNQDVELGDRLAFVDAASATIDSIAGPLSGGDIHPRDPAQRRDSGACTITPAPGERLLATAGGCEFGVVLRRTSRETKVLKVWPGADSSRTLLAINQGIAEVADPARSSVTYTARDGSVQLAVLLLPPGFEKGVKYPLIAWIYPGMLYSDTLDGEWLRRKDDPAPLNPTILASHGYVVLFPSMPLKPDGTTGDPYFHMLDGIDPALDSVVARGIADPTRMGLIGQSYGGYGVNCIASQSHRFRAGVSLAGIADLTSFALGYTSGSKYSVYPPTLWLPWAESGQGRMGSPPWRDRARYERNSPITYSDSVRMPLLLTVGCGDERP